VVFTYLLGLGGDVIPIFLNSYFVVVGCSLRYSIAKRLLGTSVSENNSDHQRSSEVLLY